MSNSWGSVETGVGTKFLKLENEETVIRVGSGPSEINVHFEESISGGKKRVICPGAGCLLCQKKSVPFKRVMLKVINREDDQAYLFEFGMMIASDIKKYAVSPKHGNPTQYDIKIQKIGAGKQTKYKVFASPNKSEITASEAAQLAELDLEAAIKVTSIEEVKAMGLKILPVEIVNQEPEMPDLGDVNDDDWNKL